MNTTNRLFTPVKLRGDETVRKVKGQAASQAAAHAQDLLEPNAFAPLRQNNQAQFFTTGKAYFEAVSAAMKVAKKSIFIAGWQVNWDVELTPGNRLIDILHERVNSSPSFRVFVMPWMSPKIGLDTFDLDTMLAIFQINAGRASMQAMCCPTGPQSDYSGTEGAAFSHHQKLVVIDNEVAYVGGIDLAYGRYDDHRFSLSHEGRKVQERYNPGIPGTMPVSMTNLLTMTDLLKCTLSAGKWVQGGDTTPGALSEFIGTLMTDAKKQALAAASAVNKGAANMLNAGRSAAGKDANPNKINPQAAAKAVVATAHSVSNSCAALQIPDFFGGYKINNIASQPVISTKAVNDVNGAIVKIAGLSDFLAPLRGMQVSPDARSPVAGFMQGVETTGRSGINALINAEAALIGKAEQGAVAAQRVCVQIGPGVESGVAHAKAAARQGVAQAKAAVYKARDGVNAFQQAILIEINNIRETINTRFLAVVAQGDQALERMLGDLSQNDLHELLSGLMRLAKLFYSAQVSLQWQSAIAHPRLLQKVTKAAPPSGMVLGPDQPRQPWQDVQVEIRGPSVDDVARNFIDRWNAAQRSYLEDADKLAQSVLGKANGVFSSKLLIPAHLVPPKRTTVKGPPTGVAIRVLRSAPLKMCQDEARARGDKVMPKKEQHEIQTQMVNLIRGATDFIYIENQFFQTAFGEPSVDSFSEKGINAASAPMQVMQRDRMNKIKCQLSSAGGAKGARLLPANDIGRALGARIESAIRWGYPFHVYIVLPVHPEGRLDDITIAGQVHWTMQSLVFGDQSLVNRIRRALAAKKICKDTLSQELWDKAVFDSGTTARGTALYQKITESEWSRYLTLLNLRTCQTLLENIRTEQIYIHSKLMIVDDRHVIVGSANINDRSQTGKRDSELAVMLFDTKSARGAMGRQDSRFSPLARKLRIHLWRKHLALDAGSKFVLPASEVEAMLEKPASRTTFEAIQRFARENARIYSAKFPHVPSDVDSNGMNKIASIWPVAPLGSGEAGPYAKLMPFHEEFWQSKATPVSSISGIRGFFTALPTSWTQGENNHPGAMSVLALSQNVAFPKQDNIGGNIEHRDGKRRV